MRPPAVFPPTPQSFDASSPDPRPGSSVLVEDNFIAKSRRRPSPARRAQVIDLARTHADARPDRCHVHVCRGLVDLGANAICPMRSSRTLPPASMQGMLMRALTSVRDAGGADIGLVHGVEQGLMQGRGCSLPAKALTQTGGHATIAAASTAAARRLSRPARRARPHRRWCRRGAPRGAREIQGRGALRQADGQWRHRVTDRPDPFPRILTRRDRSGGGKRRPMPAPMCSRISIPTKRSAAALNAAFIRSSTAISFPKRRRN